MLAVIVTLGLVLSGVPSAGHSQLAPADEYFGPTKMSVLEVGDRINDAEIRGGSYYGLLATQAAIEDWARKYPADPWIPWREYQMSHLFARLHSHAGNREAHNCRYFIRSHFPGTPYAVAVEREANPQAARRSAKSSTAHVASRHPAKKRHRFLGIF
jgi:hypothetical protein